VCRDSGRGGAAGEGLATGVVAERDFWTSVTLGISCFLLNNQFQSNFQVFTLVIFWIIFDYLSYKNKFYNIFLL
jgi:hypothetical protein